MILAKEREVTCQICGKVFKTSFSRVSYCSKECANIATRKRMKEINLIRKSKYKTEKERIKIEEQRARAKESISKIEAVAKEAKAQGMSYGQYVAKR